MKIYMKIYRIFILVLCALCARAVSNAQLMETISYSPLKNGYYEYISTKSLTRLATDKDAGVTIGSLKANSATLFLKTKTVTFKSPLKVRNGVFARPDAHLNIEKLTVNGYFYANGGISGKDGNDAVVVEGSPLVSAKVIDAKDKNIKIYSGQKVYINGIELQRPPCGEVEWKQYDATKVDGGTVSVKVLGCK